MKKTLLATLILILTFSCKSDKKVENKINSETTTYYLIRHAEKDRSNDKEKDPRLTDKGVKRSKDWIEILNNVQFDYIYSTNYQRTLQTATPIAVKSHLEIQTYDPSNLYDEEFQKRTKNKTALIVGHSNTTPAFVNTIIGEEKYLQIDDSDNGKLYIVTIDKDTTLVKIEDYNYPFKKRK